MVLTLIDDIGSGPVGVDASVFIYFIEAAPIWRDIVRPLFRAADAGQLELVTSAVTLLEVLVVPCRANDHALANRYESLLTRSRGVRLIDITRGQLRLAAGLRGAHRIGTPDALQLAAARDTGCSVFVTNDRRLPALPTPRIVRLSDYANPLPLSPT